MELDELHVLYRALGAVDHRYAVAGRDEGVGGSLVDGSYAAGRHQGDAGQELVYAPLGVQDVGAVAGDVGGTAGYDLPQVVLGDDFDGEMVLVDVDVRVGADGLDQAALDFEAGVVGVVQDAELRVASLAVEVERAVGLAVEVHAPFKELAYLAGSAGHDFFYRRGVGEPVAGDHRVADMLLEVVNLEVRHRRHSPLGQGGVGLFELCLADKRDPPGMSYFQGEAHSGDAAANN